LNHSEPKIAYEGWKFFSINACKKIVIKYTTMATPTTQREMFMILNATCRAWPKTANHTFQSRQLIDRMNTIKP
jgi:hypothetical protein